jgi:hypothetical protein
VSDIEIYEAVKANTLQKTDLTTSVHGEGKDDLVFDVPKPLKHLKYQIGKTVKNRLLCYK